MFKKLLSLVAVTFLATYCLTHWDAHALKASALAAEHELHGATNAGRHDSRGARDPGLRRPEREAGSARESVRSSPHVALGLPTDADPSDDILLDEQAFFVSYNPGFEGPNWVAWRLDQSTLGHTRRRNDFRPDPALPSGLHRVTPEEYAHSGFDRGHMCPSGDRDESPEDNTRTFVMTNMLPQVHELNAGPWEKLEEYERELARKRNAAVYIVAGGIFGQTPSRLPSGIAIPESTYKIIVALEEGQTATEVSEKTKVIAVVMPNRRDVADRGWHDYVTSVEAIEKLTGYDYLSNVPAGIQKQIEREATR